MRSSRLCQTIVLSALAAAVAVPAASFAEPLKNRQEIALWPGNPPGTDPAKITTQVIERSKSLFYPDRALVGITKPSMTAILPEKPNGISMIVIPGGAYARIVLDKEADEMVAWLKPLGVTVFLTTHRLPAEGHVNGKDVPLEDAQRAVRLIRANAAEWGLDPARIGYMGFSAAGHVGASLVAGFDKKVYEPVDAADKVSARPDFAILGYPVVSTDPNVTHMESRDNLLGKTPSADVLAAYSPDLNVTKDSPKTFIFAAADDPAVPPENSIRLFQGLLKAKVPAELHIFMEGGHGFGVVRAAGLPASGWPILATQWMNRIGVLK